MLGSCSSALTPEKRKPLDHAYELGQKRRFRLCFCPQHVLLTRTTDNFHFAFSRPVCDCSCIFREQQPHNRPAWITLTAFSLFLPTETTFLRKRNGSPDTSSLVDGRRSTSRRTDRVVTAYGLPALARSLSPKRIPTNTASPFSSPKKMRNLLTSGLRAASSTAKSKW